jgi:SPP1 family predicted phage head-tail adaptor
MTAIKSGDLRDRVSILKLDSATVGDYGETAGTFAAYESRSARFEYLAGNELEQARKVWASTTARIMIRKPQKYSITTEYRISFGGAVWGIGAIIPVDDSHGDLLLFVAEIH